MDILVLKQYLEIAYELEASIFTYQKVIEYSKKRKNNFSNKNFVKLYKNKKDLKLYKINRNNKIQELTDVLKQQQNVLKEFYSINAIRPKYRNLVAIATIYGYIKTARCSELEGANGAYALYKQHLRSNLVSSSINKVMKSLETIKICQYELYEKIKSSVLVAVEMLNRIKNSQSIEFYYTKAKSLMASVDDFFADISW